MSLESYKQAIRDGDLPSLRVILRDHPEYLDKNFNFKTAEGDYSGFALNLAAACDQPEVIEFLVGEMGVDINRQKGHASLWTALHHACEHGACAAAEALLGLGANPQLKSEKGDTPYDKCTSEKIKEILRAGCEEQAQKTKERKLAGAWTLTSPVEVVYTRELPDHHLRLTEIFNFESRRVTSITKDLRGGQLAQNILFFDDIPDTQFVHEAYARLRELGGTADEGAIDRRLLKGKSPLSGH